MNSIKDINSILHMQFKGADRTDGFDQPRVWSVLTPLAQELKAVNLVFIL